MKSSTKNPVFGLGLGVQLVCGFDLLGSGVLGFKGLGFRVYRAFFRDFWV